MGFSWFRRILCSAIVLIILAQASMVQAARGVPGSPEFGIGASVNIAQGDLPDALRLLADLQPDWLKVEVRWDSYEPEPGYPSNWETLDQTIQAAAQQDIPVLISLTAAPAWGLTESGPDHESVARFVLVLVNRYPGNLQAIELFPSANTLLGWQAQPNPADYLYLVLSVQSSLTEAGSPVWIVAGGLNPCSPDADALEYLSDLYALDGQSLLKIISLQFHEITGAPYDPPSGCQNLRFYERVREVMTAYHHFDGKIWITQLNLPDGLSPQDQQDWLTLAYTQIRSQLYFGSAILIGLNGAASGSLSLLQPEGGLHVFNATFQSLIDHNHSLSQPLKPGRSKAFIFTKSHP